MGGRCNATQDAGDMSRRYHRTQDAPDAGDTNLTSCPSGHYTDVPDAGYFFANGH